MHAMFKNPTQRHETNVFQYPHTCMALTISLLFLVGGCTSTSAPTSPEAAVQEKKQIQIPILLRKRKHLLLPTLPLKAPP